VKEENSENTLVEIKEILSKINSRLEFSETDNETKEILRKIDNRVENSLNQIQLSFDKIHDRLFNFNSVLIAIFLVLGTFPYNKPIIELWTSVFPIANLLFLIYIEWRQMEIHRFASNEVNWTEKERIKHGKLISSQSLISLLSIITTIAIFIFIGVEVLTRYQT